MTDEQRPLTPSEISRRDLLRRAALGAAACAAGPWLACATPTRVAPPVTRTGAPKPGHYRYTDAHCHTVDFLQQTDGLKALLGTMDAFQVDHMHLMGLPVIKKWHYADPRPPMYYLDDDARCYFYSATDVLIARMWLAQSEDNRKRLHPFLCGFNPTSRHGVEHVKRILELYPDVFQGIGEVFTRHDDLTALTYGETARADHRALDPVYELAAANDLAVQLHCDVGNKHLREPVYIHEMENALSKHPETRMILAHAGISRGFDLPSIVDDVRGLLQHHGNLWVDLSWVVFEQNLVPDGKPDLHWTALVEEFPDKFMIGTDEIGHFATYDITKYDVFLDTLKPETARRVARDNYLYGILPKRISETFGLGGAAEAAPRLRSVAG